ncbi:MAG: invasion associated locus B family protein [Pseudorhodobacter sp.]
MRHSLLRLAGLLAILGLAGPLQAEVANGTVFGDWRVNCTAESSTRTACALTQAVAASEGNRFLAELGLNVLTSDGAKSVVLVLRTPSAMLLPLQPGFLIEGAAEQVSMTWRTCAGDFCTAIQALDEATVASMRAAPSMIVGYQGVNDPAPTSFAVSLRGVTAGLTALMAD